MHLLLMSLKSQKVTTLSCCNFDMHEPILMTFAEMLHRGLLFYKHVF